MFDSLVIVRKLGEERTAAVMSAAKMIHRYAIEKHVSIIEHSFSDPIPKDRTPLFVALGGDGTLLYAASLSMGYHSRGVVGFNMGNLGFLTEEIYSADTVYPFLDAIYDYANPEESTVIRDPRQMLTCNLVGPPLYAMNEITLTTSMRNFMHADVLVNRKPVTRFSGNGVSVTTPTGSTALGLSAGGAIIHPDARVLQIVPLLAHSVAKQPIIVSSDDVIDLIGYTSSRTKEVDLLVDSRVVRTYDYDKMHEQFSVQIQSAHKDVILWRPKEWNFFKVLANKFKWH